MAPLRTCRPSRLGQEEIDGRTDLFPLGVVLYEMAAGRLPFQGSTSAGIFNAIINKPRVPLARINPELPQQLDWIIGKALEKDRRLRFQGAAELRADLARLRRETESGRAATAAVAAGASPVTATRRTRGVVASAAGAVLLVSATGLAVWQLRLQPDPAAVTCFTIPLEPGELICRHSAIPWHRASPFLRTDGTLLM